MVVRMIETAKVEMGALADDTLGSEREEDPTVRSTSCRKPGTRSQYEVDERQKGRSGRKDLHVIQAVHLQRRILGDGKRMVHYDHQMTSVPISRSWASLRLMRSHPQISCVVRTIMNIIKKRNIGTGIDYFQNEGEKTKDERRLLVLDLFLQPIPQLLSKFVIISFCSTPSLSSPWDQKLTIIVDRLGHSARPQLCESAIRGRIQHEFLVPVRNCKPFRQVSVRDCYRPQRTSE